MNRMQSIAVVLTLAIASPDVLAAPLPQVEADSAAVSQRMLRLRSGNVVWGAIEGHDEERLTFRLLESGGLVRLPWGFLDPEEELALRTRFGYVDADGDDVMISADRLTLVDGTELIGRIVMRTENEIWIKTAEQTVPVPVLRLAGSATVVQVPALDVYTREELYQMRLLEVQEALLVEGPRGAAAQYELAQYCERILDYTHAVEHFLEAQTIDPGAHADVLPAAIARAKSKSAVQEQVDVLGWIDRWRARKRYDKAFELIDSFPSLYPSSPLMGDLAKVKDRVDKSQERDLRSEVVRRWHYWTRRLAREGARIKTFEGAMAYLDEKMGEDLLDAVTADLEKIAAGIEGDAVRRLWDERSGGRIQTVSYGNGTWLLGEEQARAELEKEEEGAAEEEGSTGDARKKLEEKIARYLKNQDLARKSKSTGADDDAEDPDAFWGEWNVSGRSQWILAYFAENSGMFKLEKVRFRNCRECGGTGAREIVYLRGALQGDEGASSLLIACPTCHHIGVVRRLRYR